MYEDWVSAASNNSERQAQWSVSFWKGLKTEIIYKTMFERSLSNFKEVWAELTAESCGEVKCHTELAL